MGSNNMLLNNETTTNATNANAMVSEINNQHQTNNMGVKITRFALVVLISVWNLAGFAQQEAMFTQHLDNQIYVNPAFAGSKEYLEITGIHRHQWAGIAGAPSSTTISAHSPLKFKSMAIGGDIFNDRIGPINRLNASLNVAYRILFGESGKLSFGLKAGVDHYQANFREIDRTNQDPNAVNIEGAMSPTFGAGIYYFAPKWFIGASVPRLTGNINEKLGNIGEAKHVFGIAGALLPITSKWEVRPSVQVRATSGAPVSTDASLAAIWDTKLWIGANYRVKESAGVYLQLKIWDQLKLGYAYDFPLSKLAARTTGSHEIMLSYGFIREVQGLVSPRYF